MARISLNGCIKFKKLVHMMRIPSPCVWGLLETLWAAAHASGNPVIGSESDVELASEWYGDDGQWFKSLSALGWIEQTEQGQWRIHDYYANCPDYVIKRIANAKGVTYKGLRVRLQKSTRNPLDSTLNQKRENGRLPVQTNPIQSRQDKTRQDTICAAEAAGVCAPFADFWKEYPRKTNRIKAHRAWLKLKPSAELAANISNALKVQQKCDQWKRGIIPHGSTWLNERRWEDEVTTQAGGHDPPDAPPIFAPGKPYPRFGPVNRKETQAEYAKRREDLAKL